MINKKSRRVLQSNKERIIKKSKTGRKTNKKTNKKVNRKANKKTKVVVKNSHKIKKASKKAITKYHKTNRYSSKKSRRKSQKVTKNTKKNNKSNSKKTTRNTKKYDKRKSKKKRKTTNTKKSKLKQRGGYTRAEIIKMVQEGTLFDIIDEKDPEIFKDGKYLLTDDEVESIIPMDAIRTDKPYTIEDIKKDLSSESEIKILERKFENLYKFSYYGDFTEFVTCNIEVTPRGHLEDDIFENSLGKNLVERLIYLLKLIKFYNELNFDFAESINNLGNDKLHSYLTFLQKSIAGINDLIYYLINQNYNIESLVILDNYIPKDERYKKDENYENEKSYIAKYYENKPFSTFLKNVVIKYKDDTGEILIFTLYNYLTRYNEYYKKYKLKPLIKGEILMNGIEVSYDLNTNGTKIYRPKTVIDLETHRTSTQRPYEIKENTYFQYTDPNTEKNIITTVQNFIDTIGYGKEAIQKDLNSNIVPKSDYDEYIKEKKREELREKKYEDKERRIEEAKKEAKKEEAKRAAEREAERKQVKIISINDFFNSVDFSNLKEEDTRKNYQSIYDILKPYQFPSINIKGTKYENFPIINYLYKVKKIIKRDIYDKDIINSNDNSKITLKELLESMHFFNGEIKGLVCFTLFDYYTIPHNLFRKGRFNLFVSFKLIDYSNEKSEEDNSIKNFIFVVLFIIEQHTSPSQYLEIMREKAELIRNKIEKEILPDSLEPEVKVNKVKTIFNEIRKSIWGNIEDSDYPKIKDDDDPTITPDILNAIITGAPYVDGNKMHIFGLNNNMEEIENFKVFINTQDKDGNTALHGIMMNENIHKDDLFKSIEKFKEFGADFNKQNKKGKTPLFYVGSNEYTNEYTNENIKDTIVKLVENGADINMKNNGDKTIIDLIIDINRYELFYDLLLELYNKELLLKLDAESRKKIIIYIENTFKKKKMQPKLEKKMQPKLEKILEKLKQIDMNLSNNMRFGFGEFNV